MGQVGRRRGVVERQQHAPVEQAQGPAHPGGGVILQRDPGAVDRVGQADHVDRLPHHLDEALISDTDPDLVPGAVERREHTEGQVVEQFVGHDHPRDRTVRQVGEPLDTRRKALT
ncbi:uncharacterized protein METZ01_LOCUS287142 [marine metagenome]|uniref:Uncharacterized protein n=1 Tax=marine metagenome TaxID=408172 RepID=A0A382LBT6_9ZZZZ